MTAAESIPTQDTPETIGGAVLGADKINDLLKNYSFDPTTFTVDGLRMRVLTSPRVMEARAAASCPDETATGEENTDA
ncbi:MAG TPA: hypothetical protein VHD60_04310 [Candidatus Saccharimonadales bacterium]|nr:hypothetical protein [Candidatus Saccharimonadales bacterium]